INIHFQIRSAHAFVDQILADGDLLHARYGVDDTFRREFFDPRRVIDCLSAADRYRCRKHEEPEAESSHNRISYSARDLHCEWCRIWKLNQRLYPRIRTKHYG